MSVDTERLREYFTSGKRFEIYGEGTLEASAVLNAAPELLDEIERLREANKMYENILRDLSPCNQFSIGLCDICDNDQCGVNFLMKKWRGERKDKS